MRAQKKKPTGLSKPRKTVAKLRSIAATRGQTAKPKRPASPSRKRAAVTPQQKPTFDHTSAQLRAERDEASAQQAATAEIQQIINRSSGDPAPVFDAILERAMRANLDGLLVKTLVETGRCDNDRGDQTRWCVGIAIDRQVGKIYWSQKGPSKGARPFLLRQNRDSYRRDLGAPLRHRGAVRSAARTDDIELDLKNRVCAAKSATTEIHHRHSEASR